MIVVRAPHRVSFLGGGSDFPGWSLKEGGLVIGSAIDKFSYLTARFLPPFHEYKHRFVYRETETVSSIQEIRHRAAKAALEWTGWSDAQGEPGLELFHMSDLPGRSGTGSSSTFLVGAVHALSALRGRHMFAHELAEAAIRIEQEVLGETVGCQDQTWAAYGGSNVIRFRTDGEIEVEPLAVSAAQLGSLQRHLLLFFTGISRTSSEVAATYVPTLDQKRREQFAMMSLAERGIEAVYAGQWQRLGELVDKSWRIKAGLSSAVASSDVHRMYAKARVLGAWGGKLTGAGGGGCLLLICPQDKQSEVINGMSEEGCVHIPFKFHQSGSTVIFSERLNISEYRTLQG